MARRRTCHLRPHVGPRGDHDLSNVWACAADGRHRSDAERVFDGGGYNEGRRSIIDDEAAGFESIGSRPRCDRGSVPTTPVVQTALRIRNILSSASDVLGTSDRVRRATREHRTAVRTGTRGASDIAGTHVAHVAHRACNLSLRWQSHGQPEAYATTGTSRTGETTRAFTRTESCGTNGRHAKSRDQKYVPRLRRTPRGRHGVVERNAKIADWAIL